MGVAICRGGYGVLLAFSMSAFTRWFVVHPVQAFAWLLRIFGRCACRYAHRLPRPCLRSRPRDASGCVRVGVYGCHGFACGRTPPRVLGGFAGIERRFRHGFRTSVRFSVGVVRCRLRRPGETSACCGVSGRFGLRNRPEVEATLSTFLVETPLTHISRTAATTALSVLL